MTITEIRELLEGTTKGFAPERERAEWKFNSMAKSIVEQLLREREAYREVAIQNSYQGVNISDESVCQLIDQEASRLLEGKGDGK